MEEFSPRILPLLWRRSIPARKPVGRPPRLTVDVVVTTAIRIADAEGLEAASMARVAAELSVATMSLYTYAPSRPELVDLMVDEVLWTRALTCDGGFRERVAFYADQTFAMYRAHPWLAELSRVRPPVGPGMLAETEFLLAAVATLGRPVDQLSVAATTISSWVTAAARHEAEGVLLRRTTGLSTDEWWQQRGEMWESWFDVESHPTMTSIWNAGAFDRGSDEQAQDAYAYGLGLLLKGIESSVEGDDRVS
ncbi:TetR/AcrR family transcriptional regulator C-terminal domain-containing protein [Actinoplanes bogorensis]|uniref:TetR/AcrR family transcriptional regulator C-terminal domain-containing protein n=1 Tax=Paractinoplanes bogorensis TaxID=1610840 RepID=A0ABS5YF56_9ACTN|nr:TetR/AcrR family transcriptional regulator C-terminal domain-containing protein [Actinoplanes bogorensis]MBU2662083.1 TetR/AcrR family transcriptional regulator C-terminal domain-containing protein [Actinoplanes bogorensis]